MCRVELALVFLFLGLVHGHNKTHVTNKDDAAQLKKRYQMECIEETRVDPDLITGVKRGDWKIPRDKVQLVKDWALCAMIKTGLMTKQGVYKIDVALKQVPKADKYNAEKLIDKCLSTKAIPASDIAFEFVKCFQKTKADYKVSIF